MATDAQIRANQENAQKSRYTGILKSSVVEKIIKKDGQVETKEFFHLPRKCNVAKNRKF